MFRYLTDESGKLVAKIEINRTNKIKVFEMGGGAQILKFYEVEVKRKHKKEFKYCQFYNEFLWFVEKFGKEDDDENL